MDKIVNFTSRAQALSAQAESKAPPTVASESGFATLLDIINPLQHLPVIGTLYRALTGDEMNSVARMAGGALYGGVIGAVAATADALISEVSGKDTGAHVLAMVTDAPEAAQAPLPEPAPAATVMAAEPVNFEQAFLKYALTLQEQRSNA